MDKKTGQEKQDKVENYFIKEDKDEDEDEDADEDSLLTFYEPLRMITKLILAKFTVLKKSGYRWTNGPTDRRRDKASYTEMRGRI